MPSEGQKTAVNVSHSDRRLKKRARSSLHRSDNSQAIVDTIAPNLHTLPFDILAEILFHAQSPKVVLAVARTSKTLCSNLLDPGSSFIWRIARKDCLPRALPEPSSNFTESSYAAFIFDYGKCDSCGNDSKQMYETFGLRMRLCERRGCEKVNKLGAQTVFPIVTERELVSFKTLLDMLPCAETHLNPTYHMSHSTWPSIPRQFRQSEWTDALAKYNTANSSPEALGAFMKASVPVTQRVKEYMTCCVALNTWKKAYLAHITRTKLLNQSFTTSIALQFGIASKDLMCTQSYGPLCRVKTAFMELMTRTDYEVRKDIIEDELVKMRDSRARREAEAAYREARLQVEKEYSRIKSAKTFAVMPSLATFRELPILKRLQTPKTKADVAKTLQTDTIQTLLRQDLEEWRDEAKEQLAVILGHPNWKHANTHLLHPVESPLGRFKCRCGNLEDKYVEAGCFDFAGACAHQCAQQQIGTKKGRKIWTSEIFTKDTKAINAISKLLTLAGIESSKPNSASLFTSIGARVQCITCSTESNKIILTSDAVVGHAHRHVDMDLKLLSDTDAKTALYAPLRLGAAKRLLARDGKIKKMHLLKDYGCRHCPIQDKKEPELFIFNGLRSHLKAKHHITDLRDEDFFFNNHQLLPMLQ